MSVFRFKHKFLGKDEFYTAEERGDVFVVSWREGDNGHDESGSTEYSANMFNAYVADGTYVIVPDPEPCEETPSQEEELGTYRPVLEQRKVGKVRVQLVDDGFPLALREVAKVMTWAQTAKGYKDHDWQNLPNAQVELAAAASRHRTDQIAMHVVEGKPLLECTDPESELVHKAHEAFGVLAQLELMLRERAV